MCGKYFKDLEVGSKFITPSRTLTEADIILFSSLTGDQNPIHTDEEFSSRHSIFKTRVVHGLLTYSIAQGLLFRLGIFDSVPVAFIGVKELRFMAPVFPGDTIHVDGEVMDKRASKSRPGFGIVTFKVVCRNQKKDVIFESETTDLVALKPR